MFPSGRLIEGAHGSGGGNSTASPRSIFFEEGRDPPLRGNFLIESIPIFSGNGEEFDLGRSRTVVGRKKRCGRKNFERLWAGPAAVRFPVRNEKNGRPLCPSRRDSENGT